LIKEECYLLERTKRQKSIPKLRDQKNQKIKNRTSKIELHHIREQFFILNFFAFDLFVAWCTFLGSLSMIKWDIWAFYANIKSIDIFLSKDFSKN